MVLQLLSGTGNQPRVNAELLYSLDNTGMTPLHIAAARNYRSIASLLTKAVPNPESYITEQSVTSDSSTRRLFSAFQVAVADNSADVVELFLGMISDDRVLIRPDPHGMFPLEVRSTI